MKTLIALAATGVFLAEFGGEPPREPTPDTAQDPIPEPRAVRLVTRDRTGRAAMLDRFGIKTVENDDQTLRETIVVYVGGAPSPNFNRVLKIHHIDCDKQVVYDLAEQSYDNALPLERRDFSPPIETKRADLDQLGEAVFTYICEIPF